MGEASGTVRSIAIDGLPFRAAMDINVTLNQSPYENEAVPTTGKSMLKKTLRSPNAESIVLIVNPSEQDVLREFSERIDPFPLSQEWADGSVWRTVGWINFENVESQENRASVTFIPDRALGAWELFSA